MINFPMGPFFLIRQGEGGWETYHSTRVPSVEDSGRGVAGALYDTDVPSWRGESSVAEGAAVSDGGVIRADGVDVRWAESNDTEEASLCAGCGASTAVFTGYTDCIPRSAYVTERAGAIHRWSRAE